MASPLLLQKVHSYFTALASLCSYIMQNSQLFHSRLLADLHHLYSYIMQKTAHVWVTFLLYIQLTVCTVVPDSVPLCKFDWLFFLLRASNVPLMKCFCPPTPPPHLFSFFSGSSVAWASSPPNTTLPVLPWRLSASRPERSVLTISRSIVVDLLLDLLTCVVESSVHQWSAARVPEN